MSSVVERYLSEQSSEHSSKQSSEQSAATWTAGNTEQPMATATTSASIRLGDGITAGPGSGGREGGEFLDSAVFKER